MPQGWGDESANGCRSDGGATPTQPKQPRKETWGNMGAAAARPAPQNGAGGDSKSQPGGLGIDAGGPHGATRAGAPNSGRCECEAHISRAKHCTTPRKLRRQPRAPPTSAHLLHGCEARRLCKGCGCRTSSGDHIV